MTFAVNHLAHFLLTARLMVALKAAAPARIINVSSAAHHGGLMRFDDLMFKKRLYLGMGAYGQSKLANVLFTYELARRLAGTGITANTVHPGLVSTNFATGNLPGILRPFSRLVMGMGITPEEGAQTSILLASEPELEEVTGKYFYQMREARSSRASHDEAAARRLWEISEELTRVTFPIS
jgi:NAD(P)-dependent dehydrogenase (short-subunit alcohol dehydrogenase family)